MAVAGVFLAKNKNNDTLIVDLDYVIPQYRDYKNGKHIYLRVMNKFMRNGFKKSLPLGIAKNMPNILKTGILRVTGWPL